MATTILWNGGTSGDMAVAANYTPAQVPIAADTLLVDGSVANPPDTNMDQLAAVNLALFFVGKDSVKDWGTSSSLFEFSADRIVLQHSRGTSYLKLKAFTDEMIVNSSATGTACVITSDGGALDNLTVTKGFLDASGFGLGIGNLHTSYRTSPDGDALLTGVVASGGATTQLLMYGGLITLSRIPTTSYVHGGVLTITSASANHPGSPDVHVYNGARIIYNASDSLNAVNIINGTFDATQVTREITIATVRVWPEGVFKKADDLVTVTDLQDMTGGDVLV